ncbi:MAG: hypothetical protein ACOC22_04695 [bacterium]
MVIFMKNYQITKVKFCCSEMSEDILLRRIQTRRWTDHVPVFFMCDENGCSIGRGIRYCPNCGAEIVGEIDKDFL